jgi:hypothetical protein
LKPGPIDFSKPGPIEFGLIQRRWKAKGRRWKAKSKRRKAEEEMESREKEMESGSIQTFNFKEDCCYYIYIILFVSLYQLRMEIRSLEAKKNRMTHTFNHNKVTS